MAPINIQIKANSVESTDFQRLADKLYAVLATETNGIDVQVTALIAQPIEVTFKPNRSGPVYDLVAGAARKAREPY